MMPIGSGNIPERLPVAPPSPAPRPAPAKPEFKPAERPELELKPDQVSFSPKAREAASLSARAKSVPEVRPQVVQDLRTRIENSDNGAANSAKIAEKLLTEN